MPRLPLLQPTQQLPYYQPAISRAPCSLSCVGLPDCGAPPAVFILLPYFGGMYLAAGTCVAFGGVLSHAAGVWMDTATMGVTGTFSSPSLEHPITAAEVGPRDHAWVTRHVTSLMQILIELSRISFMDAGLFPIFSLSNSPAVKV